LRGRHGECMTDSHLYHFFFRLLELGKTLAKHQIRLIYGGGGSGLMGLVAVTMEERGGEVIGIIPEALIPLCDRFVGQTVVVRDMHARKQRMSDSADAFIALPG
jgi:cytokinin riboside 5'-monophosphate phosphoribohydrolase